MLRDDRDVLGVTGGDPGRGPGHGGGVEHVVRSRPPGGTELVGDDDPASASAPTRARWPAQVRLLGVTAGTPSARNASSGWTSKIRSGSARQCGSTSTIFWARFHACTLRPTPWRSRHRRLAVA